MKSLFVFMIVLTTIACTNVEKIYFSCNEDYTDCTQLENDPRPDNTLDNKDAEGLVENGDNENVAVNDDDEVINEEDTEPDGDSFFPDEENPEEVLPDEGAEVTDDTFVVPDDDFCGNPCVYLYDRYDGYLGKDKDTGERIRLWMVNNACRCETQMILEQGYTESFFGFYFPVTSDTTSNTLDLGTTDREMVFTTFADGKKRYFEEIQ